MPDDRFQRWVDASSAAGAIEPFMIRSRSGTRSLRLPSHRRRRPFQPLSIRSNHRRRTRCTRLADRLTLSYFWILAAYELVRTLDQRWRTGATTLPDESGNRVTDVEAQDGTAADSTRKNGDSASISDRQCHRVLDQLVAILDSHGTSRRTRTSAGGSYLISCWISSPT